jgi:glycosyltransferase involved in cell wall biosynthesis
VASDIVAGVNSSSQRVGVVLIGRNEGQRLVRALEAVCDGTRPVVYVDSGSTDESVHEAESRGAHVVELDMSVPFTAARGRNAGFERLREVAPDAPYVMFIDGDCEIAPGWFEAATEFLDTHDDVLAVCGYRRERYPERTVYNRVCDVEWRNGPVGEIRYFGGDVLMRAEALAQIGGYDATLIAGEDEEVGIRLRGLGGKLWRIDKTSTLHDADMHELGQWWKRAKRCGHAYAELHRRYGAPPERKFADELRRTVIWGAVVPASVVTLTVPTMGLSWLGLGVYPLRAARVVRNSVKRGLSLADAVAWGISCAASPIPEAFGAAKFHLDRLRNKQSKLIEYK